jgi:hypothetical protein
LASTGSAREEWANARVKTRRGRRERARGLSIVVDGEKRLLEIVVSAIYGFELGGVRVSL